MFIHYKWYQEYALEEEPPGNTQVLFCSYGHNPWWHHGIIECTIEQYAPCQILGNLLIEWLLLIIIILEDLHTKHPRNPLIDSQSLGCFVLIIGIETKCLINEESTDGIIHHKSLLFRWCIHWFTLLLLEWIVLFWFVDIGILFWEQWLTGTIAYFLR